MAPEWIHDAACPGCGFAGASEYKQGRDRFIVCGHCNHDTRTGESPTPERAAIPAGDVEVWAAEAWRAMGVPHPVPGEKKPPRKMARKSHK